MLILKFDSETTVISNMKRGSALLYSAYIGFVVYSLLFIIWGETGLVAYQDLSEYKEGLVQNVAALKETQGKLNGEFVSLQKSSETVALYARRLGYYSEDEYPVLIQNMDLGSSYYLVGELVKPYQGEGSNALVFRVIAAMFGLSAYVFFRFRKEI